MKIAIIGCGFIGEIHLQAIMKHGLSDVILVEKDGERLDYIAKKYNIDEKYTDIDSALEGKPDGALICTPYNLHAEQSLQAMGKVKGIMVEKPMAFSVEEAQKMGEAAEAHDSFILVAYCLRFSDPFIQLKAMIDRGDLGDVFSMRAAVSSRRALSDPVSGYIKKEMFRHGIMYDYSHEIDYSQWFMGQDVREVFCTSRNSGFGSWPVDDNAEILLRFNNDAICSIHMDYLQTSFRRSIEVYGTGGTALWSTCDYFSPEDDFIHYINEKSGGWEREEVRSNVETMYLKQLHHFIKCINNEEEPVVAHHEGIELVRVICGCVDSARQGCVIKLREK